jgi:hypothetical protein
MSMELTLRILLMLSGMLDGGRREDATAEALPLLLAATGSAGGAVYLKRGDALDLAAASGMPADLRGPLSRLDLAGQAWFVAQRAAVSRALTVENDPVDQGSGPLGPGALSSAGWGTAAAYPIAMGDELLGVVVIAAPVGQDLSHESLMVLEVGGNTLAFYLSAHDEERAGCAPAPRATAPDAPTQPVATSIPLPG